MTPRLAILSGARAGATEPLSGPVASLGRHPTCHVRLDPDRDTEVANRHAVVQRKDAVWVVRDLGSAQGTYLNGTRLEAEHPLNDGDVIRLGAAGPELQFLLSDRAPVAAPSAEPALAQPRKPLVSPEEMARLLAAEEAGRLAREMAAVARKQQLIRVIAGAVLVAVVVTAVAFAWRRAAVRKAEARLSEAEIARADSLMTSVASLAASEPAMRTALDSARRSARQVRSELDAAGHHLTAIRPLMARLDSVVAREREIGAAAAFNARAAAAPSAAAIALVTATYADGSSATSTGIAVRRDGTGAVLLTTKGVAVNVNGEAPTALTVRFPGVAEALPVSVLATHDTEDLALLRVRRRGGLPIVQGLGWKDPLAAKGDPVALMGYPPASTSPDGGGAASGPSLSASTGSVSRLGRDFIMVDAWGASIGAGTPVMDREGLVVGITSTAPPAERGRLYDVVPVVYALELLDRLQ